jgi:replicative DNA helicase
MQVDVTSRMGALHPATATGLPLLDRLLAGGLRTGTLFSISGPTGIGKTAFSLLIAYMTARARAGTLFVSPVLDETEVLSRLAARALHREYPDSETTYGAIWNGQAWQDSSMHTLVSASVDTVVKKVGQNFHVFRPEPFDTTAVIAKAASALWARHERVVVVVDGVDALSAAVGGDTDRAAAANSSLESRLLEVAYELRRITEGGCAMVITVPARFGELVAPAVTLAGELRNVENAPVPLLGRALALGARPVDLVIKKNHVGPTGIVPLRFIAGAATFEERAP